MGKILQTEIQMAQKLAEYHIHGTDFEDADTDDDGLEDGIEVQTYGSNPLSYDPDSDADGGTIG